ncbi:DNA (cytosine-5-)-methyltransferase [Verrucosispora sp. TAA-831]|uniref:DNA cytosine methyltransferase n=1 Tax=Verrucosispora sp. TAA-831 TaxID=3422227 RepID=UPI003D6F5D6C
MAQGFGGCGHEQFGLVNTDVGPVDPETGQELDITRCQVGQFAGTRVRRFTLGELRRLGGFPDDYVMSGSYKQRWERIGRAVPPVMMAHLAAAIRDRILTPTAGKAADVAKPPYRVPSMTEIRDLPWNGLNVVSTFSGGGGSSLGYRMAGYRVLWASEFIPAARETYLANAAPYTKVDGRDVRQVTAADLLAATGLQVGELDLFDGSPPCASFSTAGKREAGWGKVKKYSDSAQRTDDLFFEFVRLITGVQPKVFVAENVSGLVKGSAKGYFMEIMRALKGAGYRVRAQLLDAQWLGVPQARQRLIFVGVRNDLGKDPVFPAPLPYRYTVQDALPHILAQGDNGGFGGGSMRASDHPSPTIGATPQTGNGRFPPSRVEVRMIHDTSGQFSNGDFTHKACPTIVTTPGHYHVRGNNGVGRQDRDPETGKPLTLNLGPKAVPDGLGQGRWARKLALGEVRRICGFPDDFKLTGTYEQRWERMGRAVPPVMMSHIAATVRDRILGPIRKGAATA